MADLSRVRNRMLSIVVVLAVVDIAALIYLALPLRAGASQPLQVQRAAEEELRQLSRTTVPLRGIEQKLAAADKDDNAFMNKRLPSRYSDVVEELGKLAYANHISISGVSYQTTPGALPDILNLEMHAGLRGQYVNVVKFMNALERDKLFFIIDGVGLTGETGHTAGEVRLDMKLDTYLRTQS
ncbi:MAG TPA: hypothetical protein VJ453_08380 [Terriglobales bacterium]|nr:hypothetical protein [Terriglobales bacterium]